MADSVVMITGCSSGFGLGTAVAFAELGHRVVATMRDPERSAALRAAADDAGVAVDVVALDVCETASVDAAVAEVITRVGVPDIVVNNAGIEVFGAVHLLSDDDVWAQLDTNVVGVIRVVRAVVPHMLARGSGVVVNVGSVTGRIGVPYAGIYAASKHALEALSEAMHFELSPSGVRVALIQPGQFGTALGENARWAAAMGPDTPEFARAQRFREAQRVLVTPVDDADRAGVANEVGDDQPGLEGGDPSLVVAAILEAATTEEPRLRWPVGADAELVLGVKDTMGFEDFEAVMRATLDWHD